jgi:hypothetical protein
MAALSAMDHTTARPVHQAPELLKRGPLRWLDRGAGTNPSFARVSSSPFTRKSEPGGQEIDHISEEKIKGSCKSIHHAL